MHLLGKIIVPQYLNQPERAELLEESLRLIEKDEERTMAKKKLGEKQICSWTW